MTSRWVSLSACMLIAAVSQGTFISCFPLWVVPWIGDFHVSRSAAMAGFAVGNVIMGLASPAVGFCIERFPARWNIALGGMALAVGFILGSLSGSFWQVVALYATLLAFGTAFTGLLPTQSIAVQTYPENAGFASGAVTVGSSAGGIILPAILTAPLAALGWRHAFLLTAAIVLLTIVPSASFLLSRPGRAEPALGHARSARSAPMRTSQILRKLAFWVPLMAFVPTMFLVGAVLANAVAIAEDSGIPLKVAGYLVSAIPAGGMVGSLGLGWLCDRIDYRRVFAAAAVAAMLALLLLRNHLGPPPMALAFAVTGVVVGSAFPVLGVMLVRSFGPQLFPRIMGLIVPPMIVTMAVAPVIAGWLRDRLGSYNATFWACAALMLFSAATILILGVPPGKVPGADGGLEPAS